MNQFGVFYNATKTDTSYKVKFTNKTKKKKDEEEEERKQTNSIRRPHSLLYLACFRISTFNEMEFCYCCC